MSISVIVRRAGRPDARYVVSENSTELRLPKFEGFYWDARYGCQPKFSLIIVKPTGQKHKDGTPIWA